MLMTVAMLLVVCASPHQRYGLSSPMPRPDGTIRVATYNMLNFFDRTDDPSLQGEYDDIGDNPGPTSDRRCRELAKVIRSIDADVLALQEVESAEALAWFRDTYLRDLGYDHLASVDVGYYRGIEQSFLSRFPLKDVMVWPDADLAQVVRTGGGWEEVPATREPLRFQRSPLCVTATTPDGYEVTLFSVHHKSGRYRWMREAEALQIMSIVEEMMEADPDRNIIVLGDFNAQPWDRSMQVYHRRGMSDAMTSRTHHIEHDDASPLVKTHTSGRVIDFILLNHAAAGELVGGSGFVLGTSGQEYNWREEAPPAGYASDHYPVVIDLVPREGAGPTVSGTPWPRGATRKALAASPIETVDATPRTSRGNGSARGGQNGEPASGTGFVASGRSQVFHSASCANAGKISAKNRVAYDSVADAKKDGRRPARCCKPGS